MALFFCFELYTGYQRKFIVLCLAKWIPLLIHFIGASGPSCYKTSPSPKIPESWPGPSFAIFNANLLSDVHFHGRAAPPGRARKCEKAGEAPSWSFFIQICFRISIVTAGLPPAQDGPDNARKLARPHLCHF